MFWSLETFQRGSPWRFRISHSSSQHLPQKSHSSRALREKQEVSFSSDSMQTTQIIPPRTRANTQKFYCTSLAHCSALLQVALFTQQEAKTNNEGKRANQGRDLTGLQGRRPRRPTINNTGQKHVRYTGNGNIWKD